MSDQAKPSSGYIKGFNGLRALAVLSVFLAHKAGLGFHAGELGVWIFFAISGYLIIGELHKQRRAVEAGATPRGRALRVFYTKRALRILPAYYLVLTLLFLFRSRFQYVGPDLGFMYHWFYMSNFWVGKVDTGQGAGPFGVLWSLSVEQQFYIFAPFLLVFLPSQRHRLICGIVILVAGLGHFAFYHATRVADLIYVLSPWSFAIIAMGGLLHMATNKPGGIRALRGTAPLVIILCAALAFASRDMFYHVDWLTAPFFDVGLTLCLAAVVGWVANNQGSRVVVALEARYLAYFGTISYGFYLFHNFIPNPLGKALTIYLGYSVSPEVKLLLGVPLDFALAFVAAHLSWKFFEQPILRLKKRAAKDTPRDADKGTGTGVGPHDARVAASAAGATR